MVNKRLKDDAFKVKSYIIGMIFFNNYILINDFVNFNQVCDL